MKTNEDSERVIIRETVLSNDVLELIRKKYEQLSTPLPVHFVHYSLLCLTPGLAALRG